MTVTELIERFAGPYYLEIGVNDGDSLTAALQSTKTTVVVGIDTWGPEYGGRNRGSPQWILEKVGPLSQKLMLITGDSKNVLPMLDFQADLIFVDGDHSLSGCVVDMVNCARLLKPNGVMLVDDIDHPQHTYIRKACVDFAALQGLNIEFFEAHFGVAKLTRA